MCQSINFNCSRSSSGWAAEWRVEISEGEKMPLKLIPFYYYRRAISTLCLILETKIFSTKLIETHKNSSRTQHTNRRENANTVEIFHKTKFSFVFIFRTEILWSSITGMLDCLNRWSFEILVISFFILILFFCSRLWSLILVNRENLILPCCAPIRRL